MSPTSSHQRPTADPAKNETPSDVTTPEEVNSEGGPDSGTVQVNAKQFAALQKQLADLEARANAAEADKAEAVKAAGTGTHIEDIEPKEAPVVDQTYIAHTVSSKNADGVTEFKTYRMKSEDFAQICTERGW